MSTRYVWSRKNIIYNLAYKNYPAGNSVAMADIIDYGHEYSEIELFDSWNASVDKVTIDDNGIIGGLGSSTRGSTTGYASDVSRYYNIGFSGMTADDYTGNSVTQYVPVLNYGPSIAGYEPSNPHGIFMPLSSTRFTTNWDSQTLTINSNRDEVSLPYTVPAGGTSNGTVSNASSGAYPADGVSGNYWYTLSGSDNIDASAVGYNTQTPMGGQAITINVTPGTGNVYGGTVRYTYQVRLSGGNWQTVSANNTARSLSYTIPAGTTSFAARVVASDTWGFSSSTYTTGATLSVTNNLPPTAPGSISVGSIVAGQAVTITLTAATDSDGTIASYIYERSIDGNGWTQIANVNALTYQDTVGQEWATVAYRAKAVDDDGADGPYVTSTTYTVNDGVLYISGPEVEMGTMVKPFTVNMSVGVTGNAATDVAFYVYVDGRCLHDTPVDTGESVPIAIDTRLLSTGDHIITATASKTGYVQASAAYHFETEIAALAGEGQIVQFHDYEGQPIFPRVVAAGIEGINTPTAAAVTLTTSGWVQDGTRYAQTVTVEAVTVETAVVIADCALSDDADANASIIEAWGPVMSYPITQGSSTLTFYVDSVPSINIPVNVGVM